MAVVQLCSCVDSGLFPVFTSAASDKKLASESVTGEFTIASTHTFTHHHTTILSQLQQLEQALQESEVRIRTIPVYAVWNMTIQEKYM